MILYYLFALHVINLIHYSHLTLFHYIILFCILIHSILMWHILGWEQVWGGEYIEPLTFDRPWMVEEDIARQERMMENYEDGHRSFYQMEKSIPRADGTIYDNPSQSAIVLRGLWWAHGDLLGTIPLQFPEALTKYGPAMDSFGEAYDRVKSMQGRERMSFIEVRQVVDDDEVDEESEEVDDAILRHYKYHSAFRRTYDSMLLALYLLSSIVHFHNWHTIYSLFARFTTLLCHSTE